MNELNESLQQENTEGDLKRKSSITDNLKDDTLGILEKDKSSDAVTEKLMVKKQITMENVDQNPLKDESSVTD